MKRCGKQFFAATTLSCHELFGNTYDSCIANNIGHLNIAITLIQILSLVVLALVTEREIRVNINPGVHHLATVLYLNS